MAGAKVGVAAKIKEMEPRAVFTLLWACSQPWCQRHHQAVTSSEGLSRYLFQSGEIDQVLPKARGHAV